jgi:hypothetical protein
MWFYQTVTVSNQSAYLNYLINLWKRLIYNKNLIGWRQEIKQRVVAAKGLIDIEDVCEFLPARNLTSVPNQLVSLDCM